MSVISPFPAVLLVLAATTQCRAFTVLDGIPAGFPPARTDSLLGRVAATFTHPDFVEFRRLRPGRFPGVICGEVDGRDSFGGEVGFLPFYVDENGAMLIGVEARAWRAVCG